MWGVKMRINKYLALFPFNYNSSFFITSGSGCNIISTEDAVLMENIIKWSGLLCLPC